jgi:hypothetical protein
MLGWSTRKMMNFTVSHSKHTQIEHPKLNTNCCNWHKRRIKNPEMGWTRPMKKSGIKSKRSLDTKQQERYDSLELASPINKK